MIDKSSSLTLGGREFRVWLGYSTQRRLHCNSLGEFVAQFAGIFLRDSTGRTVDLSVDAIERILCASLCDVAADKHTLTHAPVTPAQFAGMVDAELTSGQRIGEVMARCAEALDEAFTKAEIIKLDAPNEPAAQATDEEVGDEATARPRRTGKSASSAPALA